MKQNRVYESFLFEWNDEKRDKYENALSGVKKYKKRSRRLLFLNIITLALVAYLFYTSDAALIEDIKLFLQNFLAFSSN